MVLPMGTRPVETQTVYTSSFPVAYRYKLRRWQKAPYTLPMPYRFDTCIYNLDYYGPYGYGSPPNSATSLLYAFWDQRLYDNVANKAYASLRAKIYDNVDLGVNFAEARQSFGMIASTAGTLMKSFREVKQLRFGDAAKTLRLQYVPKGVSGRKSAANNWLQYYFGWVPLVKDCYEAVDIINDPLKRFQATRGLASERVSWHTDTTSPSSSVWRKYDNAYSLTVGQGLTVRAISSGAAFSLGQWGLNNPATVAWELVPFSFVVDWFVNVGEVLQSYSDYSGLQVENRWIFTKIQVSERGTTGVKPQYAVPGWVPIKFDGFGTAYERALGNQGPTLSVRNLKLPSKERAATAVSLLIQQFSKG